MSRYLHNARRTLSPVSFPPLTAGEESQGYKEALSASFFPSSYYSRGYSEIFPALKGFSSSSSFPPLVLADKDIGPNGGRVP